MDMGKPLDLYNRASEVPHGKPHKPLHAGKQIRTYIHIQKGLEENQERFHSQRCHAPASGISGGKIGYVLAVPVEAKFSETQLAPQVPNRLCNYYNSQSMCHGFGCQSNTVFRIHRCCRRSRSDWQISLNTQAFPSHWIHIIWGLIIEGIPWGVDAQSLHILMLRWQRFHLDAYSCEVAKVGTKG
jgi:hypothetical protein